MKTTLRFKKLRYQNFLSSGNAFTEIDLESCPMTLVVGDNGDGKSTFIDAICFVLFKKPFRKVNLPQLVNSVTNKGLLVEIEFEARGHEYLIRRGMKPAVFEVWVDGVLVDQDAMTKDYQAYLEKSILRTNFKTFTQIGILGSASYVPFMQLKPHDRRPIVEDIYDCGIFTVMKGLLTKRVNRIEKDLNALENERDLLLQKLELSRKNQETRVEDKQKWIEQKQEEILSLDAKLQVTSKTIEGVRIQCGALKPAVEDLDRYRKKLRELETLQTQIQANASTIKKEIAWLNHHDDCPTCKQGIAQEFRTGAVYDKEKKLTEIASGLEQLTEKMNDVRAAIESVAGAQRALSEKETKLIVLGREAETYVTTQRKLQREIEQLQSEQEEVVDEADIVEVESAIIEKKREWAEMTRDRAMMEYVDVHLKDTGIKARIIKKYSGTFNQLVNAYLAKLDFFVDFHLDENFEEVIKSRGRDNFSYNSFSEGEKLRIDLAVLFAWRDIARMRASLNTNLLIMDEIFDGSLDAQGVEELLKIMSRVTDGSNVFVISHQIDRLDGHFDRKLRFTKTKGFSKVS